MSRYSSRLHQFRKIPPERFAEFHNAFKGDGRWWQVCADCQGECEKHKVGSLMPGEADYIAGSLGLSIPAFRDQYLDCLCTPLGDIDVLKLKPGCPFLDANFRCAIRPVKVVLCDAYPIAFEVKAKQVSLFVDPECPISPRPEAAQYFERVGIPALRKLGAPLRWYRAVALYDNFNIDYERLEKGREDASKYKIFTLEQLLAARV